MNWVKRRPEILQLEYDSGSGYFRRVKRKTWYEV